MTLEQLILEYGYIILFIGTFIEGETTIILAGIAAYQGYLDLWLVILVSFLGGIAGDQTFFILGRIYGKPFIEKRPHWKVPAKKVNTLLEKHKHLVLISFRFFYGFRTVTPFVIGASHLSTTYVVTMNFIGATFWAVSMGIASFYFGKTIEMVVHSVYQYQKWVFLSVIVIASIIWLIHFYNIRRVRKEKEQ